MELAAIPGPPGRPFIGNLPDINAENPMQSLCSLTDLYGPIWKLHLGGEERIVIGSQMLMDEVCNKDRFSKVITAALKQGRNGVHDGLATAYVPQERNWGIAHRILVTQFGPLAIQNMFDQMHDIASQLVMKWVRHGPDYTIQVTDDFTRLTLDTIALCTMDYRFNSYYSQTMHPFVEAMSSFLRVSVDRGRRRFITQLFCFSENQKYWENIELMQETSRAVITARKEHPNKKKDLLNGMLYGVDPETGEQMTDDNVVNNINTFLIAGHETTSGLLTFTFYYLLKNPAAYAKTQQEVDDVIGRSPIAVNHLNRLPYLNAVLRESLRLSPTVPLISLAAKESTILGGKYYIKPGTTIFALLPMIHRDPSVYGNDADEFRPDRMLDAEFNRRNKKFPNCWKPFGNGTRACIGQSFAWQQALLVVALLLQKFNFSMDDLSYQLETEQTITMKPKGFYMRAHLRDYTSTETLGQVPASPTIHDRPSVQTSARKATNRKLVNIYYGSRTGTCENLANQLASHAADHGFEAGVVDSLNSAMENLSVESPTVIISASYEGQPASNAALFVSWIRTLRDTELANVSYAVFGCGHRDWTETFYKIPKYLDSVLEKRGGTRLAALGTTDVAEGNVLSDFKTWEDQVFWPNVRKMYSRAQEPPEAKFQVSISAPPSSALLHNLRQARVEEVGLLSCFGAVAKRHIEIKLPSGMKYSAGDYLVILPRNSKKTVRRVMKYFGISWDSVLTISSTIPTRLPTNTPISAAEVFGIYVELAQPTTKRNILALLDATHDKEIKAALARLADEDFAEEIVAKRVSVFNLLERFPSVRVSPGMFLSMLPPIRTRQYCISSSPLWSPNHVALTYSVINQPSTNDQEHFFGVGPAYLSSLAIGDELSVSVRTSQESFHLPEDSKNVPLIMVATGTGLAPFRGFIQERAAQIAMGRPLAPALFFYGCHSPEADLLYSDLFKRWQQLSAVSLRYAYSCTPERSRDCRHVQDRIYHDRVDVVKLLKAGARLFVCVPKDVAKGVRQMLIEIAKENVLQGKDAEDVAVKKWLQGAWHVWGSYSDTEFEPQGVELSEEVGDVCREGGKIRLD